MLISLLSDVDEGAYCVGVEGALLSAVETSDACEGDAACEGFVLDIFDPDRFFDDRKLDRLLITDTGARAGEVSRETEIQDMVGEWTNDGPEEDINKESDSAALLQPSTCEAISMSMLCSSEGAVF